jgi:anti-sigma factor RsiW
MTAVDCGNVAASMYDHVSGRLAPEESEAVRAHLAACEACRRVEAEERTVAELLSKKLPRYPASPDLKERLATAGKSAHGGRRRTVTAFLAAAIVTATLAVLAVVPVWRSGDAEAGPLAVEAVNDHLRVLYAERPIEIENGGIHQVKPWFSGRLDFAPAVAFDGDTEFVLQGGSVGYFVDRKAAIFVYKLRLHTISVLVFRANGLPWPSGSLQIGNERAEISTVRGFHAVLLRHGDLGYAAVSDANPKALVELLGKVVGASQ